MGRDVQGFSGLSGFGEQLKGKLLEEAVGLASRGRFLEAADRFEQAGGQSSEQKEHGNELAYAFYRRALARQRDGDESLATQDLERARQFPGVAGRVRLLIRERLTAIQSEADEDARKFDKAVGGRFDSAPSTLDLRGKFLARYGLAQPNRRRTVDGIDEISCVGVYRWAGDTNRNEQWSRLIREFKRGEPGLPAFLGRMLAEHVKATPLCAGWIAEVDCIVPVPAAARRTAERGNDIVVSASEQFGSRLRIPVRTDFLKRRDESERSRFVGKAELGSQYRFNEKKAGDVRGRTVLLLDDVMNRGHTAGVCGRLLKEHGCERVVLLVLAQAESSLQSSRHAGEGTF
ncbi:MAG: phosphoribosyltransferase [Gammaproteobacteria bacterium]|nr:phosphoribosyltransferase [Gammaproteobacteria bacterium]